MISVVEPSQLDYVWDQLRPQIKKALSHGSGDGETEENYYKQIKDGAMSLIVSHQGDEVLAGGILSIQEHPNKKTLFVELLAGRDLSSWLDESDEALRKIKEQNQADTIEASCRIGLSRMLKSWTPKAIIMELK